MEMAARVFMANSSNGGGLTRDKTRTPGNNRCRDPGQRFVALRLDRHREKKPTWTVEFWLKRRD